MDRLVIFLAPSPASKVQLFGLFFRFPLACSSDAKTDIALRVDHLPVLESVLITAVKDITPAIKTQLTQVTLEGRDVLQDKFIWLRVLINTLVSNGT